MFVFTMDVIDSIVSLLVGRFFFIFYLLIKKIVFFIDMRDDFFTQESKIDLKKKID